MTTDSLTRKGPEATATPLEWAEYYLSLGWVLSIVPPGTKGSKRPGWNTPEQWIDTAEKARARWGAEPDHGMGLIHGPSGTVAIDVDHLDYTAMVLAEFGLDLATLFEGAPRVVGKAGRDKAIFRVPPGEELRTHKAQWRHSATDIVNLFELRAGDVHDILPPSLHPEGHRYGWCVAPWELPEIPLLPADLLDLWREWPELREQVAALAPWSEPATLPRRPALVTSEQHNDVVGAYNRAVTVTTLLEAHGYRRKGKRYLAPSSSTRIPGVTVFSDGRVYSHHGSDVLADGHAHDAFDLFRLLEHGGDFRRAVRAAADLLDIPRRSPIGVPSDPSEWGQRPAPLYASPERSDYAEDDLTSPPGVLGEIVQYGLQSAIKPVPVLTVQAALALGSVVCARRYITDRRNYASLYFMSIAKSATGKEEARTLIRSVLRAAKAEQLLGPPKYKSEGAVFTALLRQPQHITVTDEIGKWLQALGATSRDLKSEIRSLFVEAFSLVHGTLDTPEYSTMTTSAERAEEMRPKSIERPGLTILGMTNPRDFYGAVTSTFVSDGFLNRFITVEHTGARMPAAEDWQDVPVPARITRWVEQILSDVVHPDQPPVRANLRARDDLLDATIVPLTGAAHRRRQEFEREMLAYADQLEGEGLGEMPGRTHEIGLRLGLIAALADTPDTPVVTDDVLDWSFRYVAHHLRRTVESLRERLADTETERAQNGLLVLIRGAGAEGVTERELHRARDYRRWRKSDRTEAIESLERGRLIERRIVSHPGAGRPRHAWVALDPDADPDAIELAAD